MIKYIYDICKKHNCAIDFCIAPDGGMSIIVYGKCKDHIIVRADWDEETIKESINDTIRRACYD